MAIVKATQYCIDNLGAKEGFTIKTEDFDPVAHCHLIKPQQLWLAGISQETIDNTELSEDGLVFVHLAYFD